MTCYDKISEKIKNFINAKENSEIVFTSGTTNSMNMIVSGFFKNLKVESSFEEIKNEMKTKLEKFRKSDIKTGFTSFGPHKDELEISIDRKNAKKFAYIAKKQYFCTRFCLMV